MSIKQVINAFTITVLLVSISVGGERENLETPLINSAELLTPDDLFEMALKYNPDHQIFIQNASLSGANLRSAWGTLMPSLDVNFQLSRSEYYNPSYVEANGSVAAYPITEQGYAMTIDTLANGHIVVGFDPNSPTAITYGVPQGKSSASYGWANLRETINLGGQQYYTIKNAGLQNDMNELQVAASKQGLQYSVKQNYYTVLAQKKLFDLTLKVLQQKQEQLHLAQARYEVGSVTELDVLQAEIDVGNQENAVIEAENSLKLAREELNRVLGIDLNSEYSLAEEFSIFNPDFDLVTLSAQAVTARPDFLVYQKQEIYSNNSVKINRGEFLPDLSASFSHTRSQNSGKDMDFTLNPRNKNTSLSLTLSWNLFSGFADEANYQGSRVALRNAQFDRKKQEQLIDQEVRQAYYNLVQTYEQSRVTEKNRELASRQLALERERYRLGASSQLNLRIAQITFEQAEVDYISSIFNFWSNLAALERAVGSKLN
ncbi:hypothetical protein CEE37_02575 [candidate division LCP-89 bacterium B3_LCP]|uniref:Transporter n=1 Tax=candidate division LCP-89 bacterium B3_LCP TaxID=2012998 RepID=A0A532V2P5_UNCL8|nr:MAG: hypothetical protein CEE37_02575 [candidate division LCP-89 bacterium B3_LCP]